MFIHEQRSMPVQRICSIAFGDKDLNDPQAMREDSELQSTAGCEPEEESSRKIKCREP